MEKIPASVFILTRNSAATLRRALESVKEFDDIVICDGASQDDTLGIAAEYGAQIFSQLPECLEGGKVRDFSCLRNDCVTHTKYDWVLFIDSDESANHGLLSEIREALRSPTGDYSAFRIPAGIILDERPIMYSSNYPGYQIRFFKKSAGKFEKPIHEHMRLFNGRSGTFSNPWHYYVYSREAESDFVRDAVRDMPLYAARYRGKPVKEKVYGFLRCAKTIFAISFKSLLNYILHGFRKTYPPRLEWLRIRYQWEIIKTIYEA